MSTQMQNTRDALDLRQLVVVVERQIRGMWRFRWWALGISWILAVASWGAIYALRDTYSASAQVFVDTDNVLRPLLRGLSVEKDVISDVAVMTRTMLTRPSLERVLRETDLDLTATTAGERDALLRSLQERIQVQPSRENIYTITFIDPNRETALNVVDKLLDTFVEDTLGRGQDDSKQAEQALKGEIADYERRLFEAEDRLKEFKRKNVGVMPNEFGDYYGQLQKAAAELEAVQRDMRIAQQKVNALDSQLEGEEPVFGIMTSTGLGGGGQTPYDMQISTLEGNIANLTVEFTDKHPELVRTRGRLEELYKLRDQYRAQNPADALGSSTNPLDLNPVYQNLKIQRSTMQVELASLRAQLADKSALVAKLKGSVNEIPQVEAELNRLNRDYDVVKTRYAEMLSRWEDLQTARRVQSSAEEVRFRIISPPFAAVKPTGPPRPLYIAAGLVIALGAGLGLALLLNILQPVYHASRDVAALGLPILGSLRLSEPVLVAAARRRGYWVLAGGFAALLLCSVITMVFSAVGARMVQALV